MNVIKSIVERRFEGAGGMYSLRKNAAKIICDFLQSNSQDACGELYHDFYESLGLLLANEESERILLYIPLFVLKNAPPSFRKIYMNAWRNLLYVQDVRENFFQGDCFELDARPEGGLERVVKCAHLLPWLIDADYISFDEIASILQDDSMRNPVLVRSFNDALSAVARKGMLDDSGFRLMKLMSRLMENIPETIKVEPLYVSKNRLKWLEESKNRKVELLTPNASLAGPFYCNINVIKPELEAISASLAPTDIVLINGSQIKGYGVVGSDLDISCLSDLESDGAFCPGSPDAAHLYFNAIWMGGEAVKGLESVANRIATVYSQASEEVRRYSIERLESDLLQYRLLHKGFSRFTDKYHFKTDDFPEIDGGCPFYDDEYRKIATMLYVKYVWI